MLLLCACTFKGVADMSVMLKWRLSGTPGCQAAPHFNKKASYVMPRVRIMAGCCVLYSTAYIYALQ